MKYIWILVPALCLLAGCDASREAPETLTREMEAGPLAFLQDGRTTREEVLLRLGVPTATFESQRIMTYRLQRTVQNRLAVLPLEPQYPDGATRWEGMTCSLVLVFDAADRLARHSLVPMKTELTRAPD